MQYINIDTDYPKKGGMANYGIATTAHQWRASAAKMRILSSWPLASWNGIGCQGATTEGVKNTNDIRGFYPAIVISGFSRVIISRAHTVAPR